MKYLKNVVFLLLLVISSQVIAQDDNAAVGSDLVQSLIASGGAKDEITKIREEQEERIIKYLTGLGPLQNVTSTIENFLPDFQLATLLSEGDAFGGSEKVNIDFSFLLPGSSVEDHNAKLKAVVNRNSKISKDLNNAFGEIEFAAQANRISSFGDVELSFSFNVTNDRFGRSPKVHNDLFRSFSKQVVKESAEKTARERLLDGLRELGIKYPEVDISGPNFEDFKFPNSDALRKAEMRRDYDNLQLLDDAAQLEFSNLVRSSEISRFNELVSNQPQLTFSLMVRDRDSLVGPDEVMAKVTYEIGFSNVNSLKKKLCPKGKLAGCEVSDMSLSGFTKAMTDDRFQAGLNAANRFSLSLEYSDVDDHEFSFNNQQFRKKGGAKLIGSLGYGRSLARNSESVSTLRMDVGVMFEEFLSDAEGNDRFVASATFTKKLSNGVSIPLTFEYANKSEFLSDDSTQFGGNLGVKWLFE